jgi:phosphonate degradation associated HDIG domain protein
MNIADTILELLQTGGQAAYFGEAVSQQEHALQTAHLAETAGAPDSLVVAALVHDLGHLLHGLPQTIAAAGIDGRHEVAGHAWLARSFGPAVTEPIRLHVAAKRYLCAVDPEYLRQLSPASVQSLHLQGGPFTLAEVRAFDALPFHAEALRLRHWDDQAKIPEWTVPGLEHYRLRIQQLALHPGGEA